MSKPQGKKEEEVPVDHYQRIKWNGWGYKGKQFRLTEGPQQTVIHTSGKRIESGFQDFMRDHLGSTKLEPSPSITMEEAMQKLPQPIINDGFLVQIQKALQPTQVKQDSESRLTHIFGKNYRDLWRMRKGMIDRAPDAILMPHSHADCVAIMEAAQKHNVVVIPFGGGTNVTGSVEPSPFETRRMIASVDMRRMTKMLSIDTVSRIATFECGVQGPDLDEQIGRHGFMLGHDPDSYIHSTLGGWIGAKGSGAYSNKYGDIEQMVLAVKVATPTGVIETPVVPRSAGPDLNALFVGSEGVFGIITEATVKIEPIPPMRQYEGWLFPSFEDGFNAFSKCTTDGISPCTMRLYDADETQMGMALKTEQPKFQSFLAKGVKQYLSTIKGWDMKQVCLCIVGFEGIPANVHHDAALVKDIFNEHKGFRVGTGAGDNWQEKKYDLPYVRDFTLSHWLWSDVFETTTVYSKAIPLWRGVKEAVRAIWAAEGKRGWIGCHTAHQYRHGCCLYFTYAGQQFDDSDLVTFLKIKRAATEQMLKFNGALTHHHGVGYEHVPWMAREMKTGGLELLQKIKQHVDPQDICNPHKLLPVARKAKETDEDYEQRSQKLQMFDKMGLPAKL